MPLMVGENLQLGLGIKRPSAPFAPFNSQSTISMIFGTIQLQKGMELGIECIFRPGSSPNKITSNHQSHSVGDELPFNLADVQG